MSGTVSINKWDLPSELLVMKNRKYVLSESLLSPKSPADEHSAQRCCPEDQTRQNGLDYNETKGGFDKLTRVIAAHSC